MKTTPSSLAAAIEQLCPNCGMCCNGVLFGDVELQRGDDAGKLSNLGLNLFRKSRKQALAQPCACFDGKLCRIYADRPKRCAAFECGLLKRVACGELDAASALKAIRATRRQVDGILRLLRDLGHHEESMSLTKRYAAVMAQPIDFSAGEAVAEQRGELMLAVAQLMASVERDFLTSAEDSRNDG